MKNIYTTNNYRLFVAENNFQNYLVLEESIGYNHCIIDWDLSSTEVSAIAQKFYTIGLTEDDFCDGENWEDSNFREMYNSFCEVESSLKVYVNDCGDIIITIHTSGFNNEYSNVWGYFDDEDAIQFLISYTNGNGDFDMEPFKHPWGKTYFTNDEMESEVEGLELVGENYILSDKVTEEWPVYSVLKRAGFHYTTERVATVHGHVPTQKDLDNIASYMDDECREDLHMEIAPCTPEYFLSEYIWKYSDADPDFYDILRDEFGFKWGTLK